MLPGGWEITTAILLAIVSFPVSLVLTRFFMQVNGKRGIVGIDVHKLSKPKIPEMCGASIPITLILLSTAYVLIGGGNSLMMLAFSLVVGSAAFVGALDDRLKMRGIYKPLLTLLFAALGFFYFNRYPSRAFAGNVGQLSVGAALGALAILSRSEIASIVAMFPNIQNSFFFLSKIKRFTEHRALTAKPTKLLDDGRLASSTDPKAPLTLVRTLLVGQPAKESVIVSTIFGLYLISAALALITMILIG